MSFNFLAARFLMHFIMKITITTVNTTAPPKIKYIALLALVTHWLLLI